MKKVASLFLAAAIIALSFFSLHAFALPATETDPVPETELLSQKWFKEHGNEYSTDVSVSVLGTVTAQKKTWYKDGNVAQLITYSTSKSQANKKTVIKDGKAVSFYPDFPLFYINEDAESFDGTSINELKFIEAYETDDGYYAECFVSENKKAEYELFFKNGELEKYVIVNNSLGVEVIFEYVITSCEVDDSEFDIPFFAINVTPIYRFLVLIGVIN